ncbi:MAG: PqqD family protein [Bdellovibrionota bacterium]
MPPSETTLTPADSVERHESADRQCPTDWEHASKIQRAESTGWRVFRQTPDTFEVLVVDFASGSYFFLADVAATIWSCIGDGIDFQTLMTVITDQYDVPREDARADLLSFLTNLLALGLVTLDE